MDTMTTVVLLLISFLAWQQGLNWLFFGMLIILIIVSRNITITIVTLLAMAGMYLGFDQYWWAFFALIAGITVYYASRGTKGGRGSEYYSPELMRLLGG